VTIPHEAINTIEDEKDLQQQLQLSNAMYTYAEHVMCNCRRCRKAWTTKPTIDSNATQGMTQPAS
jgi:uncharacterized Zn ribbon protein